MHQKANGNLDPNAGGAMKTGWLQENGKWYYLNGNWTITNR
ncbi:hypothetical protein [Bacillus clarus]|nr:hypothetical protein [Bacillus clarus]